MTFTLWSVSARFGVKMAPSFDHLVKKNKVWSVSLDSVDSEGHVVRINHNNATRDTVLDLPLDQVQPFYSSLKSFVELMNQPENMVTYRMEPGQSTGKENYRHPFCSIQLTHSIDLKMKIWHKS